MDRTSAITRLNTEEIASEVNNVIKKGLDKLLGDYLYRYELLEKTHDAIMNLPSVRNHLNLQPFPPQQYNPETKVDDVKYSQILEKLLKRIDELTFEVNQLKQTCKKECTDIKVEDDLVVVKLEQKENIRLEIEEEDVSEADDDSIAQSEEEDEEEEETVLSTAESSSEAAEESDAILEEENICSECDCKVILDEDIIVVDGKNYCGACDPTSSKEEEDESLEEEEVVEEVKSSSANEIVAAEVEEEEEESDEVETEKSESVADEAEEVASSNEIVAAVDEEEEEFIEIDIDDVTYCTNNEENGFIYELTEDGDVGDKVGYLKDGEPFFYADEK
jgi:hypothetical protein